MLSFFKFVFYSIAFVLAFLFFVAAVTPERKPDMKSCRDNFSMCTDNTDLVRNNLNIFTAQRECQEAAAKQAKYGEPKWPSDAFEHYSKGEDAPKIGRVTLIAPDAQFQNGFGAFRHVRVACIYDLKARTAEAFIFEK